MIKIYHKMIKKLKKRTKYQQAREISPVVDSTLTSSETTATPVNLTNLTENTHNITAPNVVTVASAIALEMNNPLSILSANCRYLTIKLQDDLQAIEVLQENQAQMDRMAGLVSSLIDVLHQRNEDDWMDIGLANLVSVVIILVDPLLKQLSFSDNQWVRLVNDVPVQGIPKVSVEPHQVKAFLVSIIRLLLSGLARDQQSVIRFSAEFLLDSEKVLLRMESLNLARALTLPRVQALIAQSPVTMQIDDQVDHLSVLLYFPVRSSANAHLPLIDASCMSGFSRVMGEQLPLMLENLQTEFEQLNRDMRQTFEQKDWSALCTQVHGVKGLSRSICAYRLGQHAVELEFFLRQETIDVILVNAQFDLFIETLELTSLAFKAYVIEHVSDTISDTTG